MGKVPVTTSSHPDLTTCDPEGNDPESRKVAHSGEMTGKIPRPVLFAHTVTVRSSLYLASSASSDLPPSVVPGLRAFFRLNVHTVPVQKYWDYP